MEKNLLGLILGIYSNCINFKFQKIFKKFLKPKLKIIFKYFQDGRRTSFVCPL